MNTTIARLSLRALLGQRRGIVVAVLPVLLVLLAVVVQVLTDGASALEPVVVVFGMGLVLPVVALLVTNGVLGPEIEDGSIVYLLAKPVSRHVVAVSKLTVAVGVTLLAGAGSVLLAAFVLDPGSPGTAVAAGVGSAVAGTAYCAVFVVLSAGNRHGIVGGLLYVLGFEGLLAVSLGGLRYFSVGAYGRTVAGGLDRDLDVATGIGVPFAVVAALVVTVLGAAVAGQRLRSFQLRGDE